MTGLRCRLARLFYAVGAFIDPRVDFDELEKRLTLRHGETWHDAVERVNQGRS